MIKLFTKIRVLLHKLFYSLKARILTVISVGVFFGILAFILLRATISLGIDNYYNDVENKKEREKHYIEDLQTYVDKNALSSSDNASIGKWIEQRKYIYLFVYKDDEFFYAGGDYDPGENAVGGVTLDYPTFDEIKEYAEQNDLHTLTMSDGTLLVSVADFTRYFYYDVANLASLVVAIMILSLVVLVYFYDITKRISLLAADVKIVSELDMNHAVLPRGRDELTALSENVEKMRAGMLDNLKREREARDANTELITAMSHDIRTPLTVLLGYIDVMKMQASDEVMKDYIAAAEATALRLKELSDDTFKYFLLYGNEDAELELVDYDAKTLLMQAVSEHSLYLKENGVELVARDSADIPAGAVIRTDVTKLMRIIDNVCSNIVKYADRANPVEMSVVSSEGVIEITFKNVIDKGRTAAESNGIGLRSAARLAEMIGGALKTERIADKFSLRLSLPVCSHG